MHFIDFLSTLQEVSGADYPQNLNGNIIFPSPGKSFLPQLLGDASNERNDPIFWQWRQGKAVRDGNWKLVAHKDVWELYNLESDPVEEMNLIEKEKEKAAQLKARYEDWAVQFEITKR